MNAQAYNDKILEYRKSRIKVYPCNNLRASNIGHPCERYLYLSIKNWEDRPPHDVTLQSIFDLGNHLEDYAINTLKAAGFEILTPTERSWKIEKPVLITGREDLRIKETDGQLYPVEVKGLAAPAWEKLNCFEDFLKSKQHYIRAYPAQLMVYMYHWNKEKGYFCLINKQTGEIKMIEIALDYEYAEQLFQKGERIYAALSAGKPEGLDTADDFTMCDKCDLKHCCTAKREAVEAEIDDGTIEALISEKNGLQEAYRRYNDVGDEIKAAMNGRERVVAGTFLVTKTSSERKEYVVKAGVTERINIKKL